ncbi:MAG: hypothetical protein AB9866_17025 [Syntrophobacteraceae bacterium]
MAHQSATFCGAIYPKEKSIRRFGKSGLAVAVWLLEWFAIQAVLTGLRHGGRDVGGLNGYLHMDSGHNGIA